MQWIDIGANLTHESFEADREAMLARAASHGVVQMIVTGASVASSRPRLRSRVRMRADCSPLPECIRITPNRCNTVM